MGAAAGGGGGSEGVAVLGWRGRRGVKGWNDEVALLKEYCSTVVPRCSWGFNRWGEHNVVCSSLSEKKEKERKIAFFCFCWLKADRMEPGIFFTVFFFLSKILENGKKWLLFYILLALFLMFFFSFFKLLFWLTYWKKVHLEILTFSRRKRMRSDGVVPMQSGRNWKWSILNLVVYIGFVYLSL